MSSSDERFSVDYPSTDDIERIKKDKERFIEAKKMSFMFSNDINEARKQWQLPEEEYDKLIDKHYDDKINIVCRSSFMSGIGLFYGEWYFDEIEKDLRNLIKETHRIEYEKVRDIKYKYDVKFKNELFQKISPEYHKYISNIAFIRYAARQVPKVNGFFDYSFNYIAKEFLQLNYKTISRYSNDDKKETDDLYKLILEYRRENDKRYQELNFVQKLLYKLDFY